MDVLDYVNTQSQKAAAYLDALARTSPAVQQASQLYRIADRSGLISVIKIGLAAHEFSDALMHAGQHLIAMDLDQSSHHLVEDPSVPWVTDQLVDQPRDQAEDMALDAAEEFAHEVGREQMTEQEELRRQQDAARQDPAELEAEKRDAAQLEANRKADELASQSRQQEAGQQAAEVKTLQATHEQQLNGLHAARDKELAGRAEKDAAWAEKLSESVNLGPEGLKTLAEAQEANQQMITNRYAADEADLRREQATEMADLQAKQVAQQHPDAPPPPPAPLPPPPPAPPTRSF